MEAFGPSYIEIRIGAPNAPVLNDFIFGNNRCEFIMGPLGSGKTVGCCQRILRHIEEQAPNAQGVRPSRWLAVRNTYPDLTGTTIKDFREVFDGMGQMKMGGLEPPTFHVGYKKPDGTSVKAEVVFLALDRDDAVRKIRGYQLTGVWLNETKELVKPVLDMLDLRHGRYPSMASGGVKPTYHGMIGDTNAPDNDHWYWYMAEETRPKGWKFHKQPGGMFERGVDNLGKTIFVPNLKAENLEHLPEGYYSRGVEGKKDDWVRVNLCNEYGFTVDGKPVHPEYVDSVHCSKDPIAYDPTLDIVLGVDFGRTPAAILVQPIPAAGRYLAIDEVCTDDMSASLFAPYLKNYLDKNYPGAKVRGWGDPAGDHAGETVETTPIDLMRAAGIPMRPAPTNKPILRRAAVSRPFTNNGMDGRPRLIISPACKRLRKGLQGGFCYRRLKVVGDEKYQDAPDKNMYSHPVEAFEYALVGEGEGRDALIPAPHVRASRGPRQREARM